MVEILLGLIRADREGDWYLHLASIKSMIPWCFAMDKTNYSRYLPVCYAQMTQLEQTCPDLHTHFLNGGFSVQLIQANPFVKIVIDQTVEETVNKDTKTAGGTKGVKRDENDVKSIVDMLENNWTNPFSNQPSDLVSLSIGAAATSAITSDLLKARSKGEEAFKIHKERLESGSGFFDPIKKQNLQTFTVLQKNTVVNAGTNREMILKADNRVFGNMLLIAQSRKLDMKDVLQYPLGPKPWALANADGTLKKTGKATLGNHLEKEVANVDVPSGSCATIVDAMAIVQMIPGENMTFDELSDAILKKIFNDGRGSGRIDVVFDLYQDQSIKAAERINRGSKYEGRVHVAVSHYIMNLDQQALLCTTPFWDQDFTWNTNNPDFTWCFQDTVLVWIPCGFLLLCLPYAFYRLCRKTDNPISWNIKNMSKLTLIILLFALQLTETISLILNYNSTISNLPITQREIAAIVLTFSYACSLNPDPENPSRWKRIVQCKTADRRSNQKSFKEVIINACDLRNNDWAQKVRLRIEGPMSYLNAADTQYHTFCMSLFFDNRNIDRSKDDIEQYDIFVLPIFLLHKRKGIHTSRTFFFFWLLMTVSQIIRYRSLINNLFKPVISGYYNFNGCLGVFDDFEKLKKDLFANDDGGPILVLGINFAIAPLVFGLFCLELIPDNHPDSKVDNLLESPENFASYFSQIWFWWIFPLMLKGSKKTLLNEDVYDLNEESQAKILADELEDNLKGSSLLKALFKQFGLRFFLASVVISFSSLLAFVTPLIINTLIDFISSDEPLWRGVLYAAILLISNCLNAFMSESSVFKFMHYSLLIKSALSAIIYRKALKLSSSAKIDWTTGEVINLVSVDAQRIYEGTQFTFLWITGTIYLVFSIYFLFRLLGLATLAGVGVFIIIIPVNISLSKLVDIIQTELLKIKDERVKMISEVLSGMKVLKLYAWELPFEELIVKLREKEVTTLKKSLMFEQAMVNIFIIAPAAVSLLTFAAFIYGTNEVLTPNIAFVSMSLFEILRIPLNELPFVIGEFIKSAASFRRISNFIQCEEIGENIVNKGEASSNALTIENGVFTWEKSSEVCLSDINMNVEQGQLVAIVGSVGSGKSSLLSATLGEMYKLKGAISVQGRVAYVPQQAWIQNATVRDNITFNTPFLVERYEKVLKKCALETDLKILTAGDQTEIGEKGINLSGGQKQRVSLARAVYNDADIYLFDDPLSAVDSHVGKYLFDNVIGPGGILKNKTRILVTHGLTYLPECDYVHMLKDGKIIESGSYSSMMESGKAFSELVAQFNIGQEKERDVVELEEQTYIDLSGEPSDPWYVRSDSIASTRSLYRRIKKPKIASKSNFKTSYHVWCQIKAIRLQNTNTTPEESLIVNYCRKSPGKLIDDEGIEEGNISRKVYIHYIMAVGRFFCAILVFGFGMFTGLELFANQWLTIWSTKGAVQNGIVDLSFNNYYIGIYTMLIVVEGISFFIGLLAHSVGSTNASKKIHNVMLERMMRAPMSFFDTTPMGRIINRFSRDVNTMDSTLIIEIQKFTFFIWRVIGAMIIICANIPLFTIIAFIITVIYCRIMVKSIRSIRQLMRLESIYRSPVFSHVQESISGSTSIRAYEVEDLFIQRIYDRLDNNMKFYYANIVVNSWVAVVLQIIGSVMVFFTALFAALARETLNPAVVGLTVNYASSITMTLYFLVRSAGIVESNIVSVERLLEYTKLPQEVSMFIYKCSEEYFIFKILVGKCFA
ncbi:Multidrug resistance-associated protein 1 [Nymphon striatum]|nr:Multidrug resistance-associated protein 1 [Nymphon striatum]